MTESQILKDLRDQISVLRQDMIHMQGYCNSLNSNMYDLERKIESLKEEVQTLGQVVFVGDCETND